ncbi:MAG: HD domain-containing protein [Patescibacteria group bacterium]
MKIIKFYEHLDKLKRTKRAGWVNAGIKSSESVSDHSFSTSVLSMILAPKLKVDTEKFIKMGLIHDIGESIIGDVLWYTKDKGVDKKKLSKKEEDEGAAMKKILELLGGDEYLELWTEMEEKKTREAKMHKEIDRLDLALQAYFNEKRTGVNLDGFFDFADLFIESNEIKDIMKEIRKLRK